MGIWVFRHEELHLQNDPDVASMATHFHPGDHHRCAIYSQACATAATTRSARPGSGAGREGIAVVGQPHQRGEGVPAPVRGVRHRGVVWSCPSPALAAVMHSPRLAPLPRLPLYTSRPSCPTGGGGGKGNPHRGQPCPAGDLRRGADHLPGATATRHGPVLPVPGPRRSRGIPFAQHVYSNGAANDDVRLFSCGQVLPHLCGDSAPWTTSECGGQSEEALQVRHNYTSKFLVHHVYVFS